LLNAGMESQVRTKLFYGIHYLRDSGVVIEGVTFWGAPWIIPYAGAWNLPDSERRRKWALIPDDVDVLITHEAPFGILDDGHGCKELATTVKRVRPRMHCFGHHERAHGNVSVDGTAFHNAAYRKGHNFLLSALEM